MAMDMAAMMPRRVTAAVMAVNLMVTVVVTLGAMMMTRAGRGGRCEGESHRGNQS